MNQELIIILSSILNYKNLCHDINHPDCYKVTCGNCCLCERDEEYYVSHILNLGERII